MSNFSFKSDGFKELSRELTKLQGKDARKKLRSALKKGARVIIDQARSNLPSEYSTLKKSLVSQFRKPRTADYQTIKIAFTYGKGAKYDGWYAHMVERGTDPHEINPLNKLAMNAGDDNIVKSVRHPGVHARPFFRPAFDSRHKTAVAVFGRKLFSEIKKDIKK